MEWRIGLVSFLCMLLTATSSPAQTEENEKTSEAAQEQSQELNPWVGKYPMSFFTKMRSANVVGRDHLSVSMKTQFFDWDEVKGADDDYHDRAFGQSKRRIINTLCFKYGWAKNHHIAIGIPYWFNDFDIPGKENDYDGFANVFVFEKWKVLAETNTLPAVAVDVWYYFPTGDSDKKLGTDDGSIKLTAEVSKAWKYFSLHASPGYTWGQEETPDVVEFNAAILTQPAKVLWPAVEYNYYEKKESGHRHDLVPGIICKFAPGWSLKVGLPINLDSTFTDRDELGVVFKLFKRW